MYMKHIKRIDLPEAHKAVVYQREMQKDTCKHYDRAMNYCTKVDKWCLMEHGYDCEEYIKELQDGSDTKAD